MNDIAKAYTSMTNIGFIIRFYYASFTSIVLDFHF